MQVFLKSCPGCSNQVHVRHIYCPNCQYKLREPKPERKDCYKVQSDNILGFTPITKGLPAMSDNLGNGRDVATINRCLPTGFSVLEAKKVSIPGIDESELIIVRVPFKHISGAEKDQLKTYQDLGQAIRQAWSAETKGLKIKI